MSIVRVDVCRSALQNTLGTYGLSLLVLIATFAPQLASAGYSPCTLSASPASVTAGSPVTLSWSTDAYKLDITGGIGTKFPSWTNRCCETWSGSTTIHPTSNTTYTGTAYGYDDIQHVKDKVYPAATAIYNADRSWGAPTNAWQSNTLLEQLEIIYFAYLDRAGDSAGMNYWRSSGFSDALIAESFGQSAEAKARYPFLASPYTADKSAFITKLYADLLDRAPDETGFQYWLDELTALVNAHDDARIYRFPYTFARGSLAGGNRTCSVTVTATAMSQPGPTCTISASPSSVAAGQPVTLTWTSTNSTGASINKGVGTVAVNGTKIVTPTASGKYTLTVTGANGTASCSTGNVTVNPPTTPAPTCTISASPSTVTSGMPVTLAWSSNNASSATIDKGVGTVATGGSKSVTPTTSGKYTLTVTGANGTASCSTGNVTVNPPTAPTPTCSITFDKNPIMAGESTTLHWTSTNATLFYLNTLSYVGPSGQTSVTPSATTNYSGWVSAYADGSDPVYCPSAVLTVNTPPCETGYVLQGTTCVFQSCPVGYIEQNASCIFQGCPVGYVLQGGVCIWSGCPSGYIQQGQQCVTQQQCTSLPYCQGDELLNGCTHETIETCQWGCANGVCKAVPVPTATLKASPSVVNRGQTTKLTWTSQNATACTLTGSNGDSWTGLNATQKESSPIRALTTFSLHCDGMPGANPAFIEKSVRVNSVGTWSEQ